MSDRESDRERETRIERDKCHTNESDGQTEREF